MNKYEIMRLMQDEGLRKQLRDELDNDLDALQLDRGSVDSTTYVCGRMLGREIVRELHLASRTHHRLLLAMMRRGGCFRMVKPPRPPAQYGGAM